MLKAENIKKGDWLFTCSMNPVQFGEWENNEKFDGFVTLSGSSHSRRNCGLAIISETYAKFFIENKCEELFDRNSCNWEDYEKKVKKILYKLIIIIIIK